MPRTRSCNLGCVSTGVLRDSAVARTLPSHFIAGEGLAIRRVKAWSRSLAFGPSVQPYPAAMRESPQESLDRRVREYYGSEVDEGMRLSGAHGGGLLDFERTQEFERDYARTCRSGRHLPHRAQGPPLHQQDLRELPFGLLRG